MRNVISLLLAHPELTDTSVGFTAFGFSERPLRMVTFRASWALFSCTTRFFRTPSCSTSSICIATLLMAVCCDVNVGIYNATTAKLSNSGLVGFHKKPQLKQTLVACLE